MTDCAQGRYRLIKKIGQGGMGRVYLAYDRKLSIERVVKEVRFNGGPDDEKRRQQFVSEMNIIKEIQHPCIPQVVDLFSAGDNLMIVMERIEGKTLKTRIQNQGHIPEAMALDWGVQLARILTYLHGKDPPVFHRDLKPENVIITRNGSAMLLDFGIAKAAKRLDSLVTMANTVFGTPSYIAPEQAVDSSAVSPSADVYSLGIMLFEMLAGRTPWTGKSPVEIIVEVTSPEEIPDVRTLAPSVSAETADILRRMCMKKAEDRLQSADAVIEEFAKCGHTAKINSGGKVAAGETEESMDSLLAKYGNVASGDDGPAPARRSGFPWLVMAIAVAIAAAAAFFLLVMP